MTHGIIGCGRVSPIHINGFMNEKVNLKWFCDLEIDKALQYKNIFPLSQFTNDYRHLLSDKKIKSVSISVDHYMHYPIAKDALIHNKHVLLEKPIALTIEQAESLVQIADNNDLVLSIISQHRFSPIVVAIKEIIDNGLLGEISLISSNMICTRDVEYYLKSNWHGQLNKEGGSALINQGYHIIDLMRWLGGEVFNVNAISNVTKLKHVIETEETLCALLKYSNGALGSFSVTLSGNNIWHTDIKVVGTLGNICFNINEPSSIDLIDTTSSNETKIKKIIDKYASIAKIHSKSFQVPEYYGMFHFDQIHDFVRAINEKKSVLVNGEQGIKTLEVIDAIYQSVSSKKTIYMK